MRWMGSKERKITAEVTKAHGGSDAQRLRMRKTLSVLPADVRDEINDLIGEVFLQKAEDLPWDSPKRVDALAKLDQLTGGLPHAHSALFNYWPVAKSVRMNEWEPPS